MLRTTWFQSFRMVVKPAYSNFVHYIVEFELIVSCFLNILSVAAHCSAAACSCAAIKLHLCCYNDRSAQCSVSVQSYISA